MIAAKAMQVLHEVIEAHGGMKHFPIRENGTVNARAQRVPARRERCLHWSGLRSAGPARSRRY
ncbi:MAG: hypothetical protein AABZ10_07040 [Nitrospirota bacterium]